MPKLLIFETRRLVLPLETVVDALLELDRERGGRLSLSSITDARIEAGENPGLVLETLHPEALSPQQRRYSLPAIAAAMIHYCWKSKVPLPRRPPMRLPPPRTRPPPRPSTALELSR